MVRATTLRLAVLGAVTSVPLAAVWALGYLAGAGVSPSDVPLVPIGLGLAVGVLTVLVAARLTGHPTDGASSVRKALAEPAGIQR